MRRRRKAKKRSFGVFKKIFPAGIILLVFAVLFFLIFRSGLFSIKVVDIEGSGLGCVDENQLKDSSGLLGQNFFILDQKKLKKALKDKFICVKDINLSRSLPGKVQIKFFGRQPAAVLAMLKNQPSSASSLIANVATPSAESISGNLVVDSEGIIFSNEEEGLNVPKVFVSNFSLSLGQKIESGLIVNVLKILDRTKTFSLVVKESWISGDFFIINSETPGPKIIFRLDEKVDIQLGSLQLILDKAKIDSSKPEFIDLRFDKPVVIFAPKK